eukprot:CAMPEP_0117442208 /NCGR_PEP_ID=MMETSP0759-20121206/4032_1 /TAXON_ID=63605 /ORGANISM="Percolomonas cosmopolitus, Strain WS" /LENGTH=60 /DNA_ID=CAMNT_0005234087 /DNA_START=160 /DNA_END=342 /DNA_ORIENTATION=-
MSGHKSPATKGLMVIGTLAIAYYIAQTGFPSDKPLHVPKRNVEINKPYNVPREGRKSESH